jgi:hypothetical protein
MTTQDSAISGADNEGRTTDMANMSYCRFENTLSDLRDCYENFDGDVDALSSTQERDARNRLLVLCAAITEDFEDEIADIREKRKATAGR